MSVFLFKEHLRKSPDPSPESVPESENVTLHGNLHLDLNSGLKEVFQPVRHVANCRCSETNTKGNRIL